MKKLLLILAVLIPLTVGAINVTIPQSTKYGDIPVGKPNGQYTLFSTSTLGLMPATTTRNTIPKQTIEESISAVGYRTFLKTAPNPDLYSATFRVTVSSPVNQNIGQSFTMSVHGYATGTPYVNLEVKNNSTASAWSGAYYIRIVRPTVYGNNAPAMIEFYMQNATQKLIKIELLEAVNMEMLPASEVSTYSASVQATTLVSTYAYQGYYTNGNFNGGASSATYAQYLYNGTYTAGEPLVANDVIYLGATTSKWHKALLPNRPIPLGTTFARSAGTYALNATVGAYIQGRFALPTGFNGTIGKDYFLRGQIVDGDFVTDGVATTTLESGYSYTRLGSIMGPNNYINYDGNNRVYTVNNNRLERIDNLTTYTDTETNAYIHASTTIPKTYTSNTFGGVQTFDSIAVNNLVAEYITVSELARNGIATGATNTPGLNAYLQFVTNSGIGTMSYQDSNQQLYFDKPVNLTELSANNATTTGIQKMGTAVIGSLNGILKASNGVVSGSATTNDVPEAGNLYYTDARVDTYLLASTTLPEYLNYWTKSDDIVSYTAGNVGIGTTTPSEKLVVDGKLRLVNNVLEAEPVTLDAETAVALRVRNPNGYISISPMNTGWGHFYTDRSRFYFNKEVVVDTGKVSSYDEDLELRADFDNVATDNQLYLKTDGNVGVGTTTVSAKLTVQQSADENGIMVNGYDDQAANWVKLNLDGSGFGQIDSSNGFRFQKGGASIAYIDNSSSNGFRVYDNVPLSFGTVAANRFSLGYDSSEDKLRLSHGGAITDDSKIQLVVDANGNVGIGTTSPAYPLSVTGDALITRSLAIGTTYAPYTANANFIVASDDQAAFFVANLATAATNGRAFSISATGESYARFMAYSSGVLGFGPGNLTRDVYLSRSAANTLKLSSAFDGSGGGNFIVNGTTQTAKMIVTDTLGIGTTTAASKLAVVGGDIALDYGRALRVNLNYSGTSNILTVDYSGGNDRVQFFTPGNTLATPVLTLTSNALATISNDLRVAQYISAGSLAPGTSGFSNIFTNFNSNSGFLIKKAGTGSGNYISVQDSSANVLMTLLSNGNFGIATATPFAKFSVTGDGYLTGKVTASEFVVRGIPSVFAGNGAGSGATIALVPGSTDMSGQIDLTTGSVPYSLDTIFSLTFSSTKSKKQFCTYSPVGFAAGAYDINGPYLTTGYDNSFTLEAGGTGLDEYTEYSWSYNCL